MITLPDRTLHHLWKDLHEQLPTLDLGQRLSSRLQNSDLNQLEETLSGSEAYREIQLGEISDADREYLNSIGFQIEYLEQNRNNLNPVFSGRELSVYEDPLAKLPNPPRNAGYLARTFFQNDLIRDGFLVAACPKIGKLLQSTKCIPYYSRPFSLNAHFYRFCGEEVFYLVVTGMIQTKFFLYFPQRELIIRFETTQEVNTAKTINLFKAFCLKNIETVHQYLLNPEPGKKAIVCSILHFAHHLWNELSAIHRLVLLDLLKEIEHVWAANEPILNLDEIFPEISPAKVHRIGFPDIFLPVLENNCFTVAIGDAYVRQDLTERIYRAARELCAEQTLQEIAQARATNKLMVWVTLRSDLRTWKSQVPGLASILNELHQTHPSLGVVFDGYSLHGRNHFPSPNVDAENKYVEEIKAQLHPAINTYNQIGNFLYESVVWGRAVDVYFSHHGTIQHKIGWLSGKPGLVHANTTILKQDKNALAASWVSEIGLNPAYIPLESVRDISLNLDASELRVDLDNYDFDWSVAYQILEKVILMKDDHKDDSPVKQLRQKIETNANDYYAHIQLAGELAARGKRHEAVGHFRQSLEIQIKSGQINRTTIVQQLINKKQALTYLEIGVEAGINFLQIEAPVKMAVDPAFKIPGGYQSTATESYHQMTSDEFFETQKHLLKRGLDIVFIDGLHTYEQSLKDVLNSLPWLNDGGVIVMHDCAPSDEAAAHPDIRVALSMPTWQGAWMGDVYKTILHLRSFYNDLNVFVLNCDCGVGIVMKGSSEGRLSFTEKEIKEMTYHQFNQNRSEYLNLKDSSYLFEVLSGL